jgi:chorismate lyase / 3-hydroxybenzoate synthase
MTISWHDVDHQAQERLASCEHILGAISVGVAGADLDLNHPTLLVDMDVLAADESASSLITQLRTNLPVTQLHLPFEDGIFKVAHTAEHAFGVLEINAQLDIQTASHHAYRALLACCKDLGKPRLLRLWNYMPHINALENGEERYRLFNTGRREALVEANYLAKDGAPAACALGSHRGSFKIAFLAAIQPCVGIENPRQVSAYNYPKDYGFNPPIFSRAGLFAQEGGKDILFVSGTASIVGHQSLHVGDIALQTHETITNIQAVLQEANRLADSRTNGNAWILKNLHGQVYVRNPADIGIIQDILKKHELVNFTYVHADICRAELLVEIEAYAQL